VVELVRELASHVGDAPAGWVSDRASFDDRVSRSSWDSRSGSMTLPASAAPAADDAHHQPDKRPGDEQRAEPREPQEAARCDEDKRAERLVEAVECVQGGGQGQQVRLG